jgi:hypothetical protein
MTRRLKDRQLVNGHKIERSKKKVEESITEVNHTSFEKNEITFALSRPVNGIVCIETRCRLKNRKFFLRVRMEFHSFQLCARNDGAQNSSNRTSFICLLN